MSTLIDLLIITVIICFIVDCSGLMHSLKVTIASFLKKRFAFVNPDSIRIPFISCSLCSVWWAGIIYIICIGEFNLVNLAIVSMLSLTSSNISGFMLCIKDFLAAVECRIQKLIEKI